MAKPVPVWGHRWRNGLYSEIKAAEQLLNFYTTTITIDIDDSVVGPTKAKTLTRISEKEAPHTAEGNAFLAVEPKLAQVSNGASNG